MIVAWLKAQGAALVSVVQAVAADRSEPARQVVIYTVVLALIIWGVLKIIKLVSK